MKAIFARGFLKSRMYGGATLLVFVLLAVFAEASSSPFDLNIPPKKEMAHRDYIELQKLLRSKGDDLEHLLRGLYPIDKGYTTHEDFCGRCMRGIHQVLIDPEKGLFPELQLEKIGKGGDCCIVTWCSFTNKYVEFIKSNIEQLHRIGFNGHYLYMIGGYPNPTGKEIQYAGVPYAFKIFMMLEAQKKGFQKVLWIDSAAMPLKDPTPLFDWIGTTGTFIDGGNTPKDAWKFIYPETRRILLEQTGVDVLSSFYVNTVAFGLKMDTELTKHFIDDYYKMLDLGTPFLSCFPEEFVISAIFCKPEHRDKWRRECFPHIFYRPSRNTKNDELKNIKKARKRGAFFFPRPH